MQTEGLSDEVVAGANLFIRSNNLNGPMTSSDPHFHANDPNDTNVEGSRVNQYTTLPFLKSSGRFYLSG